MEMSADRHPGSPQAIDRGLWNDGLEEGSNELLQQTPRAWPG
jgi:hypothetical protein